MFESEAPAEALQAVEKLFSGPEEVVRDKEIEEIFQSAKEGHKHSDDLMNIPDDDKLAAMAQLTTVEKAAPRAKPKQRISLFDDQLLTNAAVEDVDDLFGKMDGVDTEDITKGDKFDYGSYIQKTSFDNGPTGLFD